MIAARQAAVAKKEKEKLAKKNNSDDDGESQPPGNGSWGPPDNNDGDGDSDASVDLRKAARVKEQEVIKLTPLPMAHLWRAYKGEMYGEINAASGRGDDEALKWVMQPEVTGADIEDFKNSTTRFQTLDKKFAVALRKATKHGELGRQIRLYCQQAQRKY